VGDHGVASCEIIFLFQVYLLTYNLHEKAEVGRARRGGCNHVVYVCLKRLMFVCAGNMEGTHSQPPKIAVPGTVAPYGTGTCHLTVRLRIQLLMLSDFNEQYTQE